jgi:dipeptidyl aminopeptidase/acylaminoacyl peptidase
MRRLWFALVLALAAGHAQQPPSISELADLKRIGSIQISPTSDDVAFVIEQPGEPAGIWLAPAKGTLKRLLNLRGGVSSLSWFADGASIGYLEDGRLFRLRLPDGQPEPVRTTLARITSWHAHPDGKRVVVIGPRAPANNSDPITVGDREPVDRLPSSVALTVNLDGTDERTVGSEHSMMARWSPDGRRLAIVSACGKADPAIPYTHSVEFFRGLRAFGKTAELVVYPTEGHLMSTRKSLNDLFERVVAWLNASAN